MIIVPHKGLQSLASRHYFIQNPQVTKTPDSQQNQHIKLSLQERFVITVTHQSFTRVFTKRQKALQCIGPEDGHNSGIVPQLKIGQTTQQ